MSAPTPETVLLCAVCGEEWVKHIQLAYWRLTINEDDELPSDADIEAAVSFLECVHLLKEKNRGPMGPVGAQGPMGIQGAPG